MVIQILNFHPGSSFRGHLWDREKECFMVCGGQWVCWAILKQNRGPLCNQVDIPLNVSELRERYFTMLL
jgi:hypothetical protein